MILNKLRKMKSILGDTRFFAKAKQNNKNEKCGFRTNFMLTLIFVLVSNTFFAQAAFDKFDGQDGVSTIIVNKKMFDLMSKVKVDASDRETQQYLNLIKKLDNLKVFTTKSTKVQGEMKAVADTYIKSAGLEELMRVNEDGKNIKIMVKSAAINSQIKELVMFIEGAKNEDTVLMSLTGNFDLNEISILTEKMKIPGGEELKRATKGKK